MVKITAVAADSIGAELGWKPGTELLAVNGRELLDFLDWEFLSAEDRFEVEAVLPGGEHVVFDIERPEGHPMGIELEPPRIRRCGNRCDFCFVDGLPEGLRETLYIRDDDYRLSFLEPFARMFVLLVGGHAEKDHARPAEVVRKFVRNAAQAALDLDAAELLGE